jgi:hypothetical protein
MYGAHTGGEGKLQLESLRIILVRPLLKQGGITKEV